MADYSDAAKELNAEIEREENVLLRAGVPPVRATPQAVENVLRRRRALARAQRKSAAQLEQGA